MEGVFRFKSWFLNTVELIIGILRHFVDPGLWRGGGGMEEMLTAYSSIWWVVENRKLMNLG